MDHQHKQSQQTSHKFTQVLHKFTQLVVEYTIISLSTRFTLIRLINLSIKLYILPKELKFAIITPIFKFIVIQLYAVGIYVGICINGLLVIYIPEHNMFYTTRLINQGVPQGGVHRTPIISSLYY